MEYVIKYEKLPNNLNIIQLEFKDKTILYINKQKKTSCWNTRSELENHQIAKSEQKHSNTARMKL